MKLEQRNALIQAIKQASNDGVDRVIWAKRPTVKSPKAKAPPLPYATVARPTSVNVLTSGKMNLATSDKPDLKTYKQRFVETYTITVMADDDHTAREVLEDIIGRLRTAPIKYKLRLQGLVYVAPVGPIRDASVFMSTAWEGRAEVDLTFRRTTCFDADEGVIETWSVGCELGRVPPAYVPIVIPVEPEPEPEPDPFAPEDLMTDYAEISDLLGLSENQPIDALPGRNGIINATSPGGSQRWLYKANAGTPYGEADGFDDYYAISGAPGFGNGLGSFSVLVWYRGLENRASYEYFFTLGGAGPVTQDGFMGVYTRNGGIGLAVYDRTRFIIVNNQVATPNEGWMLMNVEVTQPLGSGFTFAADLYVNDPINPLWSSVGVSTNAPLNMDRATLSSRREGASAGFYGILDFKGYGMRNGPILTQADREQIHDYYTAQ